MHKVSYASTFALQVALRDLASTEWSAQIGIRLTLADIPGAELEEPLESHTMPELRRQLQCRGITAPTSWKKATLISR